ncbi:MAG: hypothetical protein P8P26_01925 [Porticoccaceae bacterium]|nr:hypothetical protein [Porticoccaceae bacterium]
MNTPPQYLASDKNSGMLMHLQYWSRPKGQLGLAELAALDIFG